MINWMTLINIKDSKNIFACLFSVHNIISLSHHDQVSLMRLRFKKYFFHHWAPWWAMYFSKSNFIKDIFHDMINLLN